MSDAEEPIEAVPVEPDSGASDLMAAVEAAARAACAAEGRAADAAVKAATAVEVAAGLAATAATVGEEVKSSVGALETSVASANRRRTWILVLAAVGVVMVLVVGAVVAVFLHRLTKIEENGAVERAAIGLAVKEIKDCTSPDVDSPCQRRIRAGQGQNTVVDDLKADNIRSSIAVAMCLQADDPDLLGCALAKAEQLRPKPTPP